MSLRKPITEYTLEETKEDGLLRPCNDKFGYEYVTRQESEDIQSITHLHKEYRDLEFRPDDIWLDLGACIGAFSVPASNQCKQVICVEPSPANLTFLYANLYMNNSDVTKYVILPFAVTNLNVKEIEFYLHQGDNTQYHTYIKTKQRKRKSVKIRNMNFDALFCAFQPNCVKMDIEGAELGVLFSCAHLLITIDELYMEYHKHLVGVDELEQERHFNDTLELLKSKFNTVEYHGKSQPTFHCSNRR